MAKGIKKEISRTELQLKLKEVSTIIYKSLKGIPNGNVIAMLESIKLDYLLNTGIIKIDGKLETRQYNV